MTDPVETLYFHTKFKEVGKLLSANMNVTTDQAIPLDAQGLTFRIHSIMVSNASVSLTTAVGGVYTATSKGGSALVANTQVYSALTAAGKYVLLTLANNALTDLYDATTQADFYLSLTTAQGVAATADVRVYGVLL